MGFYGQHGEDLYIRSLFPEDYIGVCIEVGAYDGVTFSNTLYLEQNGWKCLCIEPIESSFNKCKQIRKECVNCCISDSDKEDKLFVNLLEKEYLLIIHEDIEEEVLNF